MASSMVGKSRHSTAMAAMRPFSQGERSARISFSSIIAAMLAAPSRRGRMKAGMVSWPGTSQRFSSRKTATRRKPETIPQRRVSSGYSRG